MPVILSRAKNLVFILFMVTKGGHFTTSSNQREVFL